ncbi:MAG: GAF and ANTAR domain-containing protein [Planctomycetes bacterium]|nr:GAF and ANTAR domain-containing protein [Planctomycetota bacterium]
MAQKSINEVEILMQIIKIVANLELPALLSEIAKILIQVTQGNSCLIYLLDTPKEELVLRGSYNPHPHLLGRIKIKMGEGITGWVAQKREVVAINRDASDDHRFKFFHNLPEDRYEGFLSVPILQSRRGVPTPTGINSASGKNGDLIGVINIQHKSPHNYSAREVTLVVVIADLVVGAIENARLYEETVLKGQEIKRLTEEVHLAREAVETRKLVERAKCVLMKRYKLDEDAAFKTIQRHSRNSRKTMREIAEMIISFSTIESEHLPK